MRRNRRSSKSRLAGGVLTLLLAGSTVWGVEPVVWRQDSMQEFGTGEASGISLSRDGAVTLAPKLDEVSDTGEQFVWALVPDGSGRLYAGTGNGGKVFRVSGDGKAEVLFDSPEVSIFSLAVGPRGTLYAGSSPDGTIYKLEPGKDGVVLCRTGDTHVWGLATAEDGSVYAATGGSQGRVLRVDAAGTVTPLYSSADPNIVSLARASDGTLYAGSDANGLVFRITPAGQTRVLFDAPMEEVHALALASDGTLYAGAMAGKGQNGAAQGTPPNRNSARPVSTAAVYAIRPSGAAVELWRTSDPMLLSLSVDGEGVLTAVTGDKGRVYRIWQDGTSSLLSRMDDVQPWAVLVSEGRTWLGTSGAGKIYRLGPAAATEGTLISSVHDFALVSRWGRLDWRAESPSGASVSLQTRSGNSEKPDDTWSDWSPALAEPGPITSPPARFLQVQATLRGSGTATPRLREVVAVAQQENVQPLVTSLAVKTPGRSEAAAPGAPSGNGGQRPEPEAPSGTLTVEWTAGDANMDHLVAAIYYKGQNEREWKLLEDELTTSSYQWNTESAPEGTVQVRVVVSDAGSNPASQALQAERVSEPFDIDHSPPTVTLTKGSSSGPGMLAVAGTMEDATTMLSVGSYSLNSGPWQVFFPADGVFDSKSESLGLEVTGLAAGEYTVVVRAADASGNVGVARTVVEVK